MQSVVIFVALMNITILICLPRCFMNITIMNRTMTTIAVLNVAMLILAIFTM